jgi:hypothetical protein
MLRYDCHLPVSVHLLFAVVSRYPVLLPFLCVPFPACPMGWKPPYDTKALGQPVPLLFWRSWGRQMALPSSRVVPLNICPALRPRWCPARSPFRFQDCCLPFRQQRRLSAVHSWVSLVHHPILFRGSITRPAFLIHPVPYFHYWFCTWVSLLTYWLGFDQMGFELRRDTRLSPIGQH